MFLKVLTAVLIYIMVGLIITDFIVKDSYQNTEIKWTPLLGFIYLVFVTFWPIVLVGKVLKGE